MLDQPKDSIQHCTGQLRICSRPFTTSPTTAMFGGIVKFMEYAVYFPLGSINIARMDTRQTLVESITIKHKHNALLNQVITVSKS